MTENIKVWKCVNCTSISKEPCIYTDNEEPEHIYGCPHGQYPNWQETTEYQIIKKEPKVREDDYIEDDIVETKYYKMEACFEDCGDDDSPYIDGKYNL